MRTRLGWWPKSIVLGTALCVSTAAIAQDSNAGPGQPASAKHSKMAMGSGSADEYPDLVEIDPFGGISLYGQVSDSFPYKLVDGGVAGIRGAVNVTKHVGIEISGSFAENNVEFQQATKPGLPQYGFAARVWQIYLDPVINLRPRGSKVQPYIEFGGGAANFAPRESAKGTARLPDVSSVFFSGNLNDNLQPQANFGGGVKFHFTDHFGMRLDARGFWSPNPTYNLPSYNDGGIYIQPKNSLWGAQFTVGLVFYEGQKKCPPMPPAPAPPAPLQQGAITGFEGQTACQGKPITLHSTASGPEGHALKYAWTLNGAPQSATGADFSFTPNNTGDFNVAVTVTDTTPPPPAPVRPKDVPERCWNPPAPPPPPAPVTATTTITVNDEAPSVSAVSASPTALSCAADKTGTHTAALTATAQAGACGGNLTYKWTVSEGSVTNDTSANATFDASTLNFEGGGQNQTKTVTATVTVTTETGKTASQSTQITVNCPPQWVRLPDVVFAKNNARVNNCGKNILIEQAAPRVANGQYTIVLVGHRGADESEDVAPAGRHGKRGRHAKSEAGVPLDQQRALNAAAVLTAGGATCATVDRSRVMVDSEGTNQVSDEQPGLCGTSNIKERKGQTVTDADKDQRVEVYLVPNPQTMPPAAKNPQPLPDKPMACPK